MTEFNYIKVATFNLFNYLAPPDAFYDFDRIYTTVQWSKKQRWLAEYLQNFQPDIIGFQEVFSIDELKKQLRHQGYNHFAVVDEPKVIDEFIYRNPVVAIASRFEIVALAEVEPDSAYVSLMGLGDDFSFSRSVLRATLDVPSIGHLDCYVVHLKSKRSMIDSSPDNNLTDEQNLPSKLKDEIAGRWASSVQRGSEAALLMLEIINRRTETSNPVILMGDFNNELQDGVLSHLVSHSHALPVANESKELKQHYALQDSWQLYQQHKMTSIDRNATHYFGSRCSVFDYILLSSEFDAGFQGSFYEVIDHHTYDRHLINPQFELDDQSTDHAVVMVTLKQRS